MIIVEAVYVGSLYHFTYFYVRIKSNNIEQNKQIFLNPYISFHLHYPILGHHYLSSGLFQEPPYRSLLLAPIFFHLSTFPPPKSILHPGCFLKLK